MKTGLSAAVIKKTFLVLALTLFTTMLVPAIQADAYVIHYAVTGGDPAIDADQWFGDIYVNSMTTAVKGTMILNYGGNTKSYTSNITAVTAYQRASDVNWINNSAVVGPPVVINGVTYVTYPTMSPVDQILIRSDVGYEYVMLRQDALLDFIIPSAAITTMINNGASWNDILGGGPYGGQYASYATDANGFVQYSSQPMALPHELFLSNYQGQITFTTTPEPGTMMLLGSGVLTFGLSRFRRRKQEAGV